VVRPFSRRPAQIEANRAALIAMWSAEHEGASPSIGVLTQIDRRAWAMSCPNKPTNLDEQSWGATVRGGLRASTPGSFSTVHVFRSSRRRSTRWTWIFLRTPRSLMRTSGPPAPAAGSALSISAPAPRALYHAAASSRTGMS
jgi:hypothetical protein